MKRVSPNFPVRRWRRLRPPSRLALLGAVVGTLVALAGTVPDAAGAAPPPPDSRGRASAGSRTSGAYLSRLGPAPLRVVRAATPATNYVLPPLAMKDPDPSPEGQKPTNAAPSSPPAPSVPDRPPEPPGPVAGGPGSLLVDPAADPRMVPPIYTPQMLVQFFKPLGSNRVAGAWSVPVFVPPSTPGGPTRSSSATYVSP